MKYEIHIGSYYDVTLGKQFAKLIISITQEQVEIIEMFADTKKDADLNILYKINNCEFRIVPILEIDHEMLEYEIKKDKSYII